MARLLSEIENLHNRKPFIGHQMLDIITSGMYDDPLMVYREYVQNSVDSIDTAVDQGKLSENGGRISIGISGQARSVYIEDNGVGLTNPEAISILVNLGCSPKEGSAQRGFRGIGRLGGLAYCDLLRFETRSAREEKIAIVEWDRRLLDELLKKINQKVGLDKVVTSIIRTSYRKPTENDAVHFFRVEMNNVHKFHSDILMNIKKVKEYLSQVAPVPYDNLNFSFAEKIQNYFSNVQGYKSYQINLNGEDIFRPYSNKIQVSTNVSDEIKDIECFEFSDTDGAPLALGWYAQTNFKGSLPPHVAMRGIRVRQGNIEIGDEFFLSNIYTERRFATWNIGEIQVWNHNIKPNSRRDGFEQSIDFERFLEQANILGRSLSFLCRKFSSDRSISYRVEKKIQEIEDLFSTIILFLDESHYESTINTIEEELDQLDPLVRNRRVSENFLDRYEKIKMELLRLKNKPCYLSNYLDGRSMRHMEKKELVQKILRTLIHEYNNTSSIKDLIERILSPYVKPYAKETLKFKQ